MSLTEAMISVLLTMSVTGAAFSLVAPVHGIVQAQPEAADLHQRMRVAVETLAAAVREADEILAAPAGALRVAANGEIRHFYLDQPEATLRRDDGGADLPVVDHVVAFAAEYVEQDGRVLLVRITLRVEAAPASLRGGPGPQFVNGGTSTSAERTLPDQEIVFDVAPRRL